MTGQTEIYEVKYIVKIHITGQNTDKGNLFKDKKYLIQLYQALHPNDKQTTEDDIKDITINNVLVDDIYNDLGFSVGNRLLILIEAQSLWTVNILFRILMYLVQTYREYFRVTEQDIYNSTKLKMPKPELYVIYLGNRKERPKEIPFSEEFFAGEDICIDVKAKIIYDGREGDIIHQYVTFTRRLLTIGKLSFEEIAIGSGLPIEEVEELAGLQLA